MAIELGKVNVTDLTQNNYCYLDNYGAFGMVYPNSSKTATSKVYLKVYPDLMVEDTSSFKLTSTATAFSITKSGYLITNNHVAESGKSFRIVVPQKESTTRKYIAEVVGIDKSNDLAILKITDPSFKGFGEIPYSIKNSQSNIGDHVIIPGFPQSVELGDNLKLSDGIIHSRSGLNQNLANYLVSVPTAPGNSGGPVINDDGEVVGVLWGGLDDYKSLIYAVKSTLLKNLVESLDINLINPKKNHLAGKSMAEKAKILSSFVFKVEAGN